LEATWLGDPHLVAQARANPLDNFRLVFNDRFIKSIVERMDDNADIFGKILDDQGFQTVVMEHYLKRVYGQARAGPEPGATAPSPHV
jgi:type I restriction enzyme R subunit